MNKASVLDQTTIEQLKRLGGDEFLHKLIDVFLKHTPWLLSAISNIHPEPAWHAVSLAAHSPKASAGNINAFELQASASDIVQAANNSNVAAITPIFIQIAPAFNSVTETFQRFK